MTMYPQKPMPLLKLTKYPNRRFYDSTRRAHVTLDDIYQLIVDGHDVEVVDSKTGDDITNVVLTQILLDRDPPKLELLPASVLHYTLRSNRQVLRAFVDRFFGPMMNNFAAFQKQFDQVLRQSTAVNPMMGPAWDWAERMMQFLAPSPSDATHAETGSPAGHAGPMTINDREPAGDESPEPNGQPASTADLRTEIEHLRRVVEQLQQRPPTAKRPSKSKPPRRKK